MPAPAALRKCGLERAVIALGGNLAGPDGMPPRATLAEALRRLRQAGFRLLALSPAYRTAPVPATGQPWYLNAVAICATPWPPGQTLARLKEIERDLGRVMRHRNAGRPLDLDLLDQGGRTLHLAPSDESGGRALVLPHPRLHRRAFVLVPLADVLPNWRHPVLRRSAARLAAARPAAERRRLRRMPRGFLEIPGDKG